MMNYLEKYSQLAPELRVKIATPAVMAVINELESAYSISLATVIMRIMVKEISIVDLPKFFVFEYSMDARDAERLADELKDRVFFDVSDYLGFSMDSETTSGLKPGEDIDDWIRMKQEAAKVRSSTFFFSPEDEEEVKDLAKRVQDFEVEAKLPPDRSREVAEKTMDEMKLRFASEDLNKRLKSIVATFIKGIRNKVDTRETLLKPVKDGGLGMDGIFIDNVLLVAEQINRDMGGRPPEAGPPPTRMKLPEDDLPKLKDGVLKAEAARMKEMEKLKNAGIRDVGYDLSALKNKPKEAAQAEFEPAPALRPIQRPPVQVSAPKAASAPVQERPNLPQPARPLAGINGKIRMEDVKYIPRLTGPIDELREMDLANFRRLSDDPQLAAKKIIEKIGFLEEESYSQRLTGIKAWRESVLNKLYLEIGRESILNKKGIVEIVSKREEEGREALKLKEFEAVMDLNKNLRF